MSRARGASAAETAGSRRAQVKPLSPRAEYHAFCARRRRAAVADREAATRYEDLATRSEDPAYWMARANEARSSALSNEQDIENRLRGRK